MKGYSANLTETCSEERLNLITDVDVKPATATDTAFVQAAIERTHHVVGLVREMSMDGAFQSPSNAEYAKEQNKQIYYSGVQESRGSFRYQPTEEGVEVVDRNTEAVQLAQEYKPGKYKLIIDGKPRYPKELTIENSIKRHQIKALPDHIKNRRHNVEASIFQLNYYTKGGKTHYGGLTPQQLWARCRGLWVNLVRIKNYLTTPPMLPA